MKFKVQSSLQGQGATSDIELSDSVFARAVNDSAIYEIIKNQLINKRQGNASSKGISEITASTKKPWRQKGTGNARAGTKKSPLWVGGAAAFGPRKRDFSYSIPKKVKKIGLCSLFSSKINEGCLSVLSDLKFSEYKTKKVVEVFSPLVEKKQEKKTRVVYIISSKEDGYNFLRSSAKNILWLNVVNVESIEAKDLFYAHKVVLSESAAKAINLRYENKNNEIVG